MKKFIKLSLFTICLSLCSCNGNSSKLSNSVDITPSNSIKFGNSIFYPVAKYNDTERSSMITYVYKRDQYTGLVKYYDSNSFPSPLTESSEETSENSLHVYFLYELVEGVVDVKTEYYIDFENNLLLKQYKLDTVNEQTIYDNYKSEHVDKWSFKNNSKDLAEQLNVINLYDVNIQTKSWTIEGLNITNNKLEFNFIQNNSYSPVITQLTAPYTFQPITN